MMPPSSSSPVAVAFQVVRNPDNHLTLTLTFFALVLGIRWIIWLQSLPVSSQFFWGVFVGITLVVVFYISQQQRQRSRRKRAVKFAQLMDLDAHNLHRLLPKEVINWVAFKEFQEVEWINIELGKIWPFLSKALSQMIREQLQPILDQYTMGLLEKIVIKDFSFGENCPTFQGVKVTEGGLDECILKAQLIWNTANEDIVFKVKTTGPDFTVKAEHLHMFGTLKLVFKPLVEEIPGFGAVLLSLTEPPKIDFDIKLLGGDINAVPGVDKMIDNSIKIALLDSLVWPSRIVCPILPGDYSFLELRPVGILDVTLLEATDVMNTDVLGKSDPFVLLYVRQKTERIKRSTTKRNTLHPVWNEGFKIQVDDPESQILTIRLMDDETVEKAEFIGSAFYPLRELEPHVPKDMWFDLFEDPQLQDKGEKPRGRVHVLLLYEPFEETKGGGGHSTQTDSQRRADEESGQRRETSGLAGGGNERSDTLPNRCIEAEMLNRGDEGKKR